MRTLLLTAFVGGLLVPGTMTPLLAHHSFSAEFDINRPIQLSGIVSKVEWINPHAWIYVDVKKRDGTTETWAIETGTPNTLLRRGLKKNDLPAGTATKVSGVPATHRTPQEKSSK